MFFHDGGNVYGKRCLVMFSEKANSVGLVYLYAVRILEFLKSLLKGIPSTLPFCKHSYMVCKDSKKLQNTMFLLHNQKKRGNYENAFT